MGKNRVILICIWQEYSQDNWDDFRNFLRYYARKKHTRLLPYKRHHNLSVIGNRYSNYVYLLLYANVSTLRKSIPIFSCKYITDKNHSNGDSWLYHRHIHKPSVVPKIIQMPFFNRVTLQTVKPLWYSPVGWTWANYGSVVVLNNWYLMQWFFNKFIFLIK